MFVLEWTQFAFADQVFFVTNFPQKKGKTMERLYSHQVCEQDGTSVFSHLNNKGRLCLTFANFSCSESRFGTLLETFRKLIRKRNQVQESMHIFKCKNVHANIASDVINHVFESPIAPLIISATLDARFDKRRRGYEITCTLKQKTTSLVPKQHASWSLDQDAEYPRPELADFNPTWICKQTE